MRCAMACILAQTACRLCTGRARACDHYPAREAATGPVIVARNDTRIACTLAIRQALGYPTDRPVVGEPLALPRP